MKIKGLLLGMFACAALVACTNDDIVENNGNDNTTQLKGDGYMTVKFAMTGNNTGRAFGDGGFVNGSTGEVGVSSAVFFFLDDNGNGCALPSTLAGSDFNWAGASSTGASIDKKSDPVIVIKNPVNIPTKIVAILNCANPFSEGVMPSLAQICAQTGNYTAQTANNFVMSNSVYVKDGAVVTAVTIPDNSIQETEEAAKAEGVPVVIPVERVLAKVQLETASGLNLSQTIDGITLAATIEGWWLDDTNPTSYLVKKLDASYSQFTTTWWNDASNSRSYWATPTTPANYTHKKYTDAIDATTPWYCQENTSTSNPTTLVLAVQWKVNNEAKDLIRFAGKLYTKDDFFSYVANNYNSYKIKTVSEGVTTYSSIQSVLGLQVNTNDTDAGVENYEAKITVNAPSGTSLVKVAIGSDGKVTSEEAATAAEIQAAIQGGIPTVNLWSEGKAYYFKPIVHNTIENVETTGIIRNHLYKMNITKISGLGTPVANPDIVIDPETPPADKESFLAATIEILSYKVVPTQNVEW